MRSSRMQEQWNSSRRILCISQCQIPFAMRKFRKANFAMPKPISQCQIQIRNAKISQCQFRNANFNFAMPIHCSFVPTCAKFRIAKFTTHFANFAKPFRIAKFTLRNLQALSSYVINAEPPSIFGVLLLCPIT